MSLLTEYLIELSISHETQTNVTTSFDPDSLFPEDIETSNDDVDF